MTLNRRPFEPQVASGYVSSQERGTINQQKPSAGGMERTCWKNIWTKEQPTRPVDLRDDGVDIDLPNREEIGWALIYQKNNKAARAGSTAAELWKKGGRNLVDALHEVI
jgi:hypothetical protein